MVAREDTISWGVKINPFSGTSWPPRGLGILIEIPIQFCIMPGKFGQGFARPRILGMFTKQWGESMRPPSLRCIDPLKTRTYETSQSCDRVHLGHLKKKHLKKRKKSKKKSKVENQNIS